MKFEFHMIGFQNGFEYFCIHEVVWKQFDLLKTIWSYGNYTRAISSLILFISALGFRNTNNFAAWFSPVLKAFW